MHGDSQTKQRELTHPNLILYGNLDGKEVIVIDADEMDVHSVIRLTETTNPYAIDRIGPNTLLSITRGFPATERIDILPTQDNWLSWV